MSSPDRDAERRMARLGPEAIARTTFPTSFRGYDPEQVRVFLDHVANELREARDREAALRTELEAVEARLADASHLDENKLTAALGEETARVLTVAREAAAEIKSKSSDSAARLLREAQEEAAALRADADSVLARRTEEAEAEVVRIRSEAEQGIVDLRAEGDRLIEDARAEAERIRAAAEEAAAAEVEDAKARGREMVDEALLVRSRVLEDLARKRKVSRTQIERLQAGRERLIDSYEIVQRTLDEATEELRTSLTSAKVAADAAARRVEAEPLPSPDELEREVEAARAAGLTAVREPEPEAEAESESQFEAQSDAASVEPPPDFADELPQEEMVPLEPSADFEEVRVVVEDAAPLVADTGAVVVDFVEVDEDGNVVEVVEVVEVAGIVDAVGDGVDEDDDASVDVDDLFARIRAAREEEVAKAQAVLASEPDVPSATEEAPPEASGTESRPEPVDEAAPDAGEHAGEQAGDQPVGPTIPPDDQALLERRDAITDEVEKQAVRKLKRVLADEQNEVLDRLRRNPKANLEDLLPAAGEHVERYAAAVRSHLETAAGRGGAFFGDEPAKTDVNGLAADLGESLTFPLRDRVDSSLREAAGDDDAMADGVRAVYRDWKTHRVASQARDTVIAAFNRGLFDATDPGTQWRWLIDDGGSPCPDAEDNSLAGLVVRGEPFPTGHCYPPAHPGCRCLLVPAPQ